jgi:predicted Zn-dependent protease
MLRSIGGAVTLAALAACASVSTQQEVQMGVEYARQINAQLPIVMDPEINRYVNVLGDSIARLADDRNLDWHFYIVDSPEVNAFAVPGGFIYINRGLIERADNLSQVAGVLGHEIGHVIQRHTIKQMEKGQAANVGMILMCVLTRVCRNQIGNAAMQVGGTALFASFSRSDENDADRVGIANVVRAGIDPRGIPEMFHKLIEERRNHPGAVDGWFSTHPLEEDRLNETEALVAKYDLELIETLTVDSPRFQEFKRRVQALPPSPPQRRPPGG